MRFRHATLECHRAQLNIENAWRRRHAVGTRRRDRPLSCGHLAGGCRGHPQAVVAEQGAEQGDQLAHDRHHGELVVLAVPRQALVDRLQVQIPADRRGRGHVQQVARVLAPATDAVPPLAGATVAVVGRDADQRGGLARADSAQLGQVGAQAGGIDEAAAGHRLNDRGAAPQRLVVGDQRLHLRLQFANVPGALGDHRLEAARRGRAELGGALAQRLPVPDQISPGGEQVAQFLQVARLRLAALRHLQARVQRQYGGIDGVVPGLLPEGPGEVPRPARW